MPSPTFTLLMDPLSEEQCWRQASTVLIRRRIDYFYTDRVTWETKLHSTRVDGVPPPQVKRGLVELY